MNLVLAILRGELQRLVRDRRAFLMAVVLPVVLFPVLFVLFPSFSRMAAESLDEEETVLWVQLDALSAAESARVRAALADTESPLTVREDHEAVRNVETFQASALDPAIFEEDCDALLVARDGSPPVLELVVHGSRTRSGEARRRVTATLEELLATDREAGLLATLGRDPAAPLELEAVDVAPPDDSLGLSIGRMLPLLAIFLVLSAGSFAALDTFAGERESGTLETLLVQPVPSLFLAWGKFLAVATIAGVAFLLNALGLFACAGFGLGEFAGQPGAVQPVRVLLALVVYAPTVLLLAGVLTWISARARSFREGQNLLFPVMLAAIAPASLATQDSVELDFLLGAIPIAGASLAMRDALTGALGFGLAVWCLAWSAGWALLALRSVASALDAERVLVARAPGSELAGDARFRRAVAWGIASVLLIYVVGGRLQSWSLSQGLAATLWLLVPALAFAVAFDLRRRTGAGLLPTLLGPRRPRALHIVGAALIAPMLAWCAIRWFTWQETWLPAPEAGLQDLASEFGGRGWQLVLLAVSPAIAEELLFRGSLLRAMGTRRPRRVVLWQVLLFAAVHASVHRFAVTGVLGGVAAAVALVSGSTVPAMVLHLVYNGLLVGLEGDLRDSWLPAIVGAAVLGVGLLTLYRPSKG
ncbi:MAG: ABC transporter permease subunit [Planctomycetota bacterium]